MHISYITHIVLVQTLMAIQHLGKTKYDARMYAAVELLPPGKPVLELKFFNNRLGLTAWYKTGAKRQLMKYSFINLCPVSDQHEN